MGLQLSELSRKSMSGCVHCGFCLAACPTYDQLGIEDDSPRGRLHLIRNIADGMYVSSKVLAHLDLCLDCRACEAACPAGVKYGRIIEDARMQLEAGRNRSFWDSRLRRFFMRDVFPNPARLRALARALRLTQRLGLDRLAVKLGIVRGRMAAMAQAARVPDRFASDVVPELVPAKAAPRHKVAFLQGCVSDVMFGPTNEATIRVLTANGCQVSVPAGQCCCGALAFHLGDLEQARRQARRNIDVFLATGADSYLTNAAGCGSTMKEYGRLLAADAEYAVKAEQFMAKVRDISEFLASIELVPPSNPVPLKVAYQDACHLAHGQGIRLQPRKLLAQIPGLELVSLRDSDTCCGSAGIYNLVQPEMADALLKRKMGNIAATGAQAVATGNAGCMMQLRLGVRQYGPEVEVVHVVDLLDRSYGGNGSHG
ncbi:MAG TPA: heterodisulfide reductase-related iron-sulfur binding cluster [Bryobacteraceae bacterium]|nr:heterodisulfide reductase-related iron-sulfur binding cluster [Bryobacteraceae bacterium]